LKEKIEMNEAAIQQDVEEVKVTGNIERNNAVAEIAAKAKEERDKELRENGQEVVDTASQELGEPEVEAEVEPVEAVEVVEEKQPEPELVEIKVDGEVRKVEKDKILDAGIRTLQKESSADKRLEEATRLLREVQEKLVKPQESQPPQEWDDATIAYALEHGDEAQKAYAVRQLRGRDNATPVEDVEKRILDTLEFRESATWFQSEYKDVVNDPYLLQLAAIAENNARNAGDTRSRKELYKAIGDELRKWKGGNNVQTMEQKKELKSEKVVNLPSASMRKTAPTEQKPKTTADIIEDMRKRRGQT